MKSLLYLNKYFVKYRVRLVSGLLFVMLSGLFKVYSMNYISDAVDYVKGLDKATMPVKMLGADHLLYCAVVFLGMTLISGFFLFLTRQTIIVTSRLIEFDLKNEVFEHYQKLDLAFYKRNNTGDLMNRISEDVGRVRMYVGPALMYTVNTVTLIGITLAFMLGKDVKLTVYVLLPMIMLYFSIYYISNLINKKSISVQQQLSILFNKAQETFSGIRVVKSYKLEKRFIDEYEKDCDEYRARNMDLAKVDSLFQPFLMMLVGLSTVIVVFVGGKEIMDGKVTDGTLVQFIMYILNLTMPIASLGWITSIVQRAAASQTRINEFLHQEPTIKSTSEAKVDVSGEIEFNHVSFVYPDSGIEALTDVSFKVARQESLGIVGKTGSGKSTIAQLICRLYNTTSGSILIDGKEIKNIPLSQLRRQIGYVPQEVFLFSDTIANNISFSVTDKLANSNDLKASVEKAAKDAVIHENIMEFTEGFETMVGERGITLSGGQKQRVSIARAMLKAPNILLFDDCISAVDTNTEQAILLNIQELMQGRTTLIISHRASSVKLCDKIIVLDKGRVVEYGTHAELVARKGAYHEMYEMQLTEGVVS